VVYAGGESEAAKTMIAAQCDAYVMHGRRGRGDRRQDRRHARRREAAGKPP
jgi:FMNH2-dependent dimethyl sulfone monooxygenase